MLTLTSRPSSAIHRHRNPSAAEELGDTNDSFILDGGCARGYSFLGQRERNTLQLYQERAKTNLSGQVEQPPAIQLSNCAPF